MNKAKTVYLLWHAHELSGQEDDEKLIGVYSSEKEACLAIERVDNQPGFKEHPEGFQICSYEINQDNWTEGFVTVYTEGIK